MIELRAFKLRLNKRPVTAIVPGNKLLMPTQFNDPAVFEESNLVSTTDGGQTVCNQEDDLLFAPCCEIAQYLLLGPGIE
jgi:hypothetical protein